MALFQYRQLVHKVYFFFSLFTHCHVMCCRMTKSMTAFEIHWVVYYQKIATHGLMESNWAVGRFVTLTFLPFDFFLSRFKEQKKQFVTKATESNHGTK